MSSSKTINCVEKLQEILNNKIAEEDKKYLEEYFRTRFVRVDGGKIIYPERKDISNKNKEINNKISEYKKDLRFWNKEKNDAENYYKGVAFKKHFKKIYWKHKIKMATDPEYKKDVENARLTEDTLMDPNYSQLVETFLVDSDYRKKLGDTVNSSLIYQKLNVGDATKKKMIFKKETALKKIESISKNILNLEYQIKVNKTMLKYK